uniref:Uncharacterized protein n=1 Tax=Rhizophora mucronata TaxID=61149 RepID=A0A2P2QJZ3_RHIMU
MGFKTRWGTGRECTDFATLLHTIAINYDIACVYCH